MDLPNPPAHRFSAVTMKNFRNIHGCTLDAATGGMNCQEASSAFGVASIQVPADAEYFSLVQVRRRGRR